MDDSRRYRTSRWLCLLVIVASLSQISLGAEYSATGEQISGGLPLSTFTLFICGIALVLLNYRKAEAPGISIAHGLLLIALSASLLGLPALSRGLAVRELIQVYEILGFSYLVFLINRRLLLDVLEKSSLAIAIVLLLLHVFHLNDHFPFYLSDTKLEAIVVLLTPFVLLNSNDLSTARKLAALATVSLLCGASFTNGGLLLCYLIIFVFSGLTLLEARRAVCACAVLTVICSLLPLGSGIAWESLGPDYDASHRKRLFIEYGASLKAPAYFPLGIGPGRYKEGINHLRRMQPLTPHESDQKVPRDGNSQYQIYLVESGPLSVAMLLACFGYLVYLSVKMEDGRERRLRLALVSSLGLTALFCIICSRGIGIIAGGLLAVASAKRFSENERVVYPAAAVFASLMFLALFVIGGKGYDDLHKQSAYNRWVVQRILRMPVLPVNRTLAVISPDRPDSRPETISVEAETASDLQPNFKIVPANNSSGDLVIESPNDSGKGVGRAEYVIEVPKSGAYRLMARVWWEDGCSNSVAVRIGGKPRIVLSDEIFKRWHVIESLEPTELRKGECTAVLHPLEDGIKIDYFGLVPVSSAPTDS
jgi:hypothetical protein